MRKILLTIVFVLMTSGTSWASACYTLDEATAEQGIRIHSELMVIGLNCQHKYKANGENLYSEYRKFTARYGDLFAGYETTLMDYFERTGVSDPERKLNTLRTTFANKISTDAATMRPDMFCYRYAPRIQKATQMDRATLEKWAGTFFPSHPVSQPLCEK